MNNNLKKYSAFYLGTLLERKKIDPVILLEYFLRNVKNARKNEKLSFVKVLKKEAFKEAQLAWKRQKKNERLSFFDGIPIVWKDLIDIEGSPAFAGSKLVERLRKTKQVKNAKVVINAKKYGLISLAKTRTVEFAFGGLGLNSSCKLPKNLMFKGQNLAAGGSSTGSATAVFSGLSPLAIGTDTAGSIRIPASWHSLVGFKPSSDLISTRGVLPLSTTFDTVGSICKTVKDTQILYNILSDSKKMFLFESRKKIKIGNIVDHNFNFLDDLSKKKIEELNLKISKLGILVENIKVPEFQKINDLISMHGSLVNYEAWQYWKEKIKKNLHDLDSNVADRFLIGKSMKANSINILRNKLSELKNNIIKKLNEYDFFILPTLAFAPPNLISLKRKKDYHYINNLILDNTRGANLFDLCAISLPLFLKRRKWLSISILSKRKNEKNLLVIAEKLESILR
ncbi:MAG: Mandelamide hydrolase [Alphaproteobacteria bacterium MarineAlpha9_Bin4]|nr:hypothetical protein [Pelagibacterales bacterium]PPR26823.1 MAG: Mandelamide hydrolase [Alphaproteobacteria bacterium MarineAlpha9_Bin4]|tara:strand:- start:221 stop:1582 length:1362 start_codon:yes stop_codon:yes gene_type:complete